MSSNLANVVLSLVAGARKDAAAVVAINLRAIAHAYAMNGGAKNAIVSARDGIKEGRKGIAGGTLPALALAALATIEATGADAGARVVAGQPADDDTRKARAAAADTYADAAAQAFRDSVTAAAAARAAARTKGKADAPAADAAGAAGAVADVGEEGNADGTNVPRAADGTAVPLADALARIAGFAAESLADALADSAALQRLRDAIACIDARAAAAAAAADAAGELAGAAAADAAAAAIVGKARESRRVRKGAAAPADAVAA
jgi:hypothetical protein